jgi:malonyl-CoA/methylmalonyl-CoA synthetase
MTDTHDRAPAAGDRARLEAEGRAWLLEAWRARGGAGIVVRDDERAWRGAQIVGHARRAAARLEPLCVGPRHVALLVEPGGAFVAALFAVLEAGATAVPLSPLYSDAELAWLLEDAAACLLLASPGWVERARRLGGPPVVSTASLPGEEATWEPPAPARAAEEAPSGAAVLMYTSGTTGRPKGALLGHRFMARQARMLAAHWGLEARDRLLHVLPLHHLHGLGVALVPCLLAGGAVDMLARFDAERVWNALAHTTVLMVVPTMAHKLLDAFDAAHPETRARWQEAARRQRLVASGSAALPPSLAERWAAVAGAVPLERYGMTEIGIVLSQALDPALRRAGRVGHAVPGVEVRLLDERGAPITGGPGEIAVRGAHLFDGYWRRPDETTFDADGWLRTGDIAERDEDGSHRILGRSSVDIIKSGGYKLSALEIEQALREHALVADVAVIGVPDELWGQRAVAAVVPRAGAALDADGLRDWAKTRLAAYKVPRAFVLVAELPRNAVGKVVKPALAASLASR